MAACPYSKVESMLFSNEYYCTSPENPSNVKKGDYTKDGVSHDRCVLGEANGITFKECPHYKSKSKRK